MIEVNKYRSPGITSYIELSYHKGVLYEIQILKADIIDWEGLRHFVAFYEEDLDKTYFSLITPITTPLKVCR